MTRKRQVVPQVAHDEQIPLERFNEVEKTLHITTNEGNRRLNNIMLTVTTPYGAKRSVSLNDFVLKHYDWEDSLDAMDSIMALQDSICKMAFYFKKMHATSFHLGHSVAVEIPQAFVLNGREGMFGKEYYLSYAACIKLLSIILKGLSFGIHRYNLLNFGK